MEDALIYRLGDIAALAQLQFQAEYKNIDPVIGINRQLRAQGFAIDLLLIECHVSKKRITLLLNDAKPDVASYQLGFSDKDPEGDFIPTPITELTQQGFFDLMVKGLV